MQRLPNSVLDRIASKVSLQNAFRFAAVSRNTRRVTQSVANAQMKTRLAAMTRLFESCKRIILDAMAIADANTFQNGRPITYNRAYRIYITRESLHIVKIQISFIKRFGTFSDGTRVIIGFRYNPHHKVLGDLVTSRLKTNQTAIMFRAAFRDLKARR